MQKLMSAHLMIEQANKAGTEREHELLVKTIFTPRVNSATRPNSAWSLRIARWASRPPSRQA